jgi:hypothetical protein
MQTLILASLLLVSSLPSSQQDLWRDFSSNEGRFSARMPADPKTGIVTTHTAHGMLLTHTVSSTDNELNEYMVSWTEYPEKGLEQKSTDRTLQKMRDALVAFNGGRLLGELVLNQGDHQGKEFKFATSEGRVVRVRFYFVKNRLYQVMGEAKEEDTKSVEEFLSSFKLLPGRPA